MLKKNTYSLAFEACETFFVETGQMPTIEAIKPIININSPATISAAIKDWKLALSRSTKKNQIINARLPKPLMEAITGIWEHALTEAMASLDGQAVELQSKQAALALKENTLNEEVGRTREMLVFTEKKYQEEIQYLKNELARLSSEVISAMQQTEHYRNIAAKNEKNNAVLNEQIRQEKDNYSRLEAQYEKEHEWALKRIEEEKDNFKKQVKNEMERLHSEAMRNSQANKLLQAKLDLAIEQSNGDKDNIIELERKLADEKLKLAELTFTTARLRNGLNVKNKRARAPSNKTAKKAK